MTAGGIYATYLGDQVSTKSLLGSNSNLELSWCLHGPRLRSTPPFWEAWIMQPRGPYQISGLQYPFPLSGSYVSGVLTTKTSSCCLAVWHSEVMAIKWDCVTRCWLHLELKTVRARKLNTEQYTGSGYQQRLDLSDGANLFRIQSDICSSLLVILDHSRSLSKSRHSICDL